MPVERVIRGRVRVGRRTKELVQRLLPDEIAVICHEDLDEPAAIALLEAKVRAVINTFPSISGRFPNRGPIVLVTAGIPLIDVLPQMLEEVTDGDEVEIKGDCLKVNGRFTCSVNVLDLALIREQMEKCKANFIPELEQFISNTVNYARREIDIVLKDFCDQVRDLDFHGRHVLVVVRGQNHKADLRAILGYIREFKPLMIGVDGGADALLECRLRPDVIVGDMDSVTDRALRCGARLIVHAYPDGRAPGIQRLKASGLPAQLLPAPGTSEDAALLLAYEKGAELIVAVGTHSNPVDFLEKGRQGMASTLLVRMKVGPLLVDARGVSQLYRQHISMMYVAEIILAALIPFMVVLVISPASLQLLRLMLIKVKVALSF